MKPNVECDNCGHPSMDYISTLVKDMYRCRHCDAWKFLDAAEPTVVVLCP